MCYWAATRALLGTSCSRCSTIAGPVVLCCLVTVSGSGAPVLACEMRGERHNPIEAHLFEGNPGDKLEHVAQVVRGIVAVAFHTQVVS